MDGNVVHPRLEGLPRPQALALGGGGARGAAQAGALLELVRHGLHPDLIIGTSVGAWNGAWWASHPTLAGADALLEWWHDREARSVFRGMWLGYAGALLRGRNAALSPARVVRFLRRGLGTLTFEDLEIPLALGAADLLRAELVYFDRGPLEPAILSSSAIPTVLPPVHCDGRILVDGGILDNYGVDEALRRGARSVLLVDAGTSDLSLPPRGLAEVVDRAALVSQVDRRRRSLEAAAAAGVEVVVLEVGAPGTVLNFRGTARAIKEGRDCAKAWLDGDATPHVVVAAPQARQLLAGLGRVIRQVRGAGEL